MVRVVVLLLIVCATATQAQFQIAPGGTPRPLGKDTICFRYDLRAGDTLIYDMQALTVLLSTKPLANRFGSSALSAFASSAIGFRALV